MSVMIFQGHRVFLSPILTKTVTSEVRRTWRERLLTLPWRPLRATKFKSVQIPSDEVIQTRDGLFMHPELWERFKLAMDQPNPKGFKERP